MIGRVSTQPVREETFGLKPVREAVTQPHLLQWIDPTFDEAEPLIDEWLRRREQKEAA